MKFKILFSLIAAASLCASAFGQTSASQFGQPSSIRNVNSVVTATFTSASGTAYTAGDSVGTSQVLTNVVDGAGKVAQLMSLKAVDSAGQGAACVLYFFNGTAPTLTDNAAFVWSTFHTNLVGQISIGTSDYETRDGKSTVDYGFIGSYLIPAATSKNLTVVCVTKGTPTYGNGGTLKFTFYFTY
jgi:hypothetical protein